MPDKIMLLVFKKEIVNLIIEITVIWFENELENNILQASPI